jgi:hypothetical protein
MRDFCAASVLRQDQLFIHHVHHQLERAAAAGLSAAGF